jgi:hypothetical protein
MRSRFVPITVALAISAGAYPSVGWCQGTAEEELARLETRVAESGLKGAARYLAYTPEFRDLARKNPGTEVALTAKLWVIQHAYYEQNFNIRFTLAGRLAEEVMTEFPDSPRLARLAELSYVFRDDQKQEILGRLAVASPHPAVRGEALLALARIDLESDDPEAIARARERLQDLRENYAAVPWRYTTFGNVADSHLDPHGPQALAIGAQAPEISGLTHDGRPVALSAFRGKVVILEFWGKW